MSSASRHNVFEFEQNEMSSERFLTMENQVDALADTLCDAVFGESRAGRVERVRSERGGAISRLRHPNPQLVEEGATHSCPCPCTSPPHPVSARFRSASTLREDAHVVSPSSPSYAWKNQ